MVSLPISSLLLAFWLLVSSTILAEAGETSTDTLSPPSGCLNCSLCGSCYPNGPPPSGYTQYGVPPPPPPTPAECPPTTVVQCCQYPYPPPQPSTYLPYYNYSASPTSLCYGQCINYVVTSTFILFFFYGDVI